MPEPGFIEQVVQNQMPRRPDAAPSSGPAGLAASLRTSGYDAGRAMVSPQASNRPKSPLGQKVYDANAERTANMQANRTEGQQQDTEAFDANFEKNRARYEDVSARTGIPAKLIAAIHWRESSGDFGTYLHQGDPLGKPAVHVPRDIPVFNKWEDAAVHALQSKGAVQKDLGMTAETQDPAAMATYAEYYNGLGYHNRGEPSPYVFAGTDQYKSGKYVADGRYDPRAVDKQMGVMGLIDSLPQPS